MSVIAENKNIARGFIEKIWNERKLGIVDEIFSEDCLTNQLRSGEEITAVPRSGEALKTHIAEWVKSFPDLSFTIEQMIADESKVFSHVVMRGTHSESWMGVAPTGKSVSIQMMLVQRIANGKIVEDWVLADFLGFFQQLNLLPSIPEILSPPQQ